MKKKILGITGGVGAGKSTVLKYLEEKYHACILMTDAIGAQLQSPQGACSGPIREAFGDEVFLENGELNRPKIASIVFSDESKLKVLNGIVHPAVKKRVCELVQESIDREDPLIVIESALLLEEKYDQMCDSTWFIYTDMEVRKERLMRDRGYSEEKAVSIMSRQLPDAYFREQCQFVIDNSSDILENTYEQVDKGLIEHGFL